MDYIFDNETFLKSLGGDKELADELLEAFLEDSPKRSMALEETLGEGDCLEASRLAHSLKGMCGVVRATELTDMALIMENRAKNGELGETRELYAKFKEALATAHAEMHDFMDS